MSYASVKSEAHRTESPVCRCCRFSKRDLKLAANKVRRRADKLNTSGSDGRASDSKSESRRLEPFLVCPCNALTGGHPASFTDYTPSVSVASATPLGGKGRLQRCAS